jgi:glutamine amidotransferase
VSAGRAPIVAIIDYGIGNLPSAQKAYERAGADARITNDPVLIAGADGVVLPGVGAMARCMESLDEYDMRGPVLDAIASGRPFMGICVGMQMLHRGSDEHGGVEGLGIFDAVVRELPDTVKKPQMQWNVVRSVGGPVDENGVARPPILSGVDGDWFYFVHSFAPEAHGDVIGVCDYGGPITAVVGRANVCGTQFHPEKSAARGIALLANFVGMCRTGVPA